MFMSHYATEVCKCPSKEQQAYKQFGNAVNVECVRLFAQYMFGDPETRFKYQITE